VPRHDPQRDSIAARRRAEAGSDGSILRGRDRGRAGAAAAALRGAGRRGILSSRRAAQPGGRRARPAHVHPGDRGAGQSRCEHRVGHQPGRDLRDVRGADAPGGRARHLDRHTAGRGGEYAWRDGQGGGRPGRLPGDGTPGLQHGVPARGLAGLPCPGLRKWPAQAPARRPARDPLSLRAHCRGRAARHLAGPRHAGHGHPPLRGARRLRARGAHGAVDGGAIAGARPALPDSAHAGLRLR